MTTTQRDIEISKVLSAYYTGYITETEANERIAALAARLTR